MRSNFYLLFASILTLTVFVCSCSEEDSTPAPKEEEETAYLTFLTVHDITNKTFEYWEVVDENFNHMHYADYAKEVTFYPDGQFESRKKGSDNGVKGRYTFTNSTALCISGTKSKTEFYFYPGTEKGYFLKVRDQYLSVFDGRWHVKDNAYYKVTITSVKEK